MGVRRVEPADRRQQHRHGRHRDLRHVRQPSRHRERRRHDRAGGGPPGTAEI